MSFAFNKLYAASCYQIHSISKLYQWSGLNSVEREEQKDGNILISLVWTEIFRYGKDVKPTISSIRQWYNYLKAQA